MSPIHVLASTNMDPLQDPRLRTHVSASLYLRILCKIHDSGSMCPIHVLASTTMDPLQDPCLRIHVSASLYLRILCKIHNCGFVSHARSMSPIHVLASTKTIRSNTQKVLKGLHGRNQNRHRATARAIRHARTPQKVARPEKKNAPRWAPATFLHQNEHGARARAIRHAQTPQRVAFANMKSAPRHSETQKIRVPTAPWRQPPNTKYDFSMFCDTSTAPATKKWVRGIRSPVTATRNDVDIAESNSTTVSRNELFEQIKTDLKSTKYCACQLEWTFCTTSKKRATLATILHIAQNPHVLHISRFPEIDTARRRERTSETDLARPTFGADEMQISMSRDNFFASLRSENRAGQSLHLDLRGFTLTVRTPQCDTLFGEKCICWRYRTLHFVLAMNTLPESQVLSNQGCYPTITKFYHIHIMTIVWSYSTIRNNSSNISHFKGPWPWREAASQQRLPCD